MKKTNRLTKLLVMLLCAALLTSSLGFGRSDPADKYDEAIKALQSGKYSEAAPLFRELGHYQDAGKYAMYAGALAEAEKGDYALAVQTMTSLGDFMDSALLAVYFTGRSYEDSQLFDEAEEVYETIPLFKDVQERLAKLPELALQAEYDEADGYEKRGDQTADNNSKRSRYVKAKAAFEALGSYSDSLKRATALQEKITAVDYAIADAYEQQGHIEDAYEAFAALGSYQDAAARADALYAQLQALYYQNALVREDADDILGAYNLYAALGDYQDAAARAAALKDEAEYRKAYAEAENGSYTSARKTYLALGDYKDAAEKARLMGIPGIAEQTKRVAAGVYAFKQSGQWGLVSLNDNLDIQPKWSSASSFSTKGLAIAALNGNGSYGLIDRRGDVVLPMGYYDIEVGSNGYYTAATGKKNSTFSLIGPEGQLLTHGWRALGNSYYSSWSGCKTYAPDFTEDTIIAQTSNAYVLLHKDGTVLLENQKSLDYMTLPDGKNALKAQGSDKLWRFYKPDGTTLTEDAWSEIGSFTAGLAPAKNADGQWGFIRQSDCQIAIEPAYTEVRAFSEGYAAVKTTDKQWGFINDKGEMVIAAEYQSVSDFASGLSTVTTALLGEHIIDKTGELVYFKETVYDRAAGYDEMELYEDAIAAFEALNGYADSDDRALQARDKVNVKVYARAEELEKMGKLLEAAETFDWLGSYADAPQRAANARETHAANTWASAEKLETEGKLEEAIAIYLTLGDYRSAAQHAADLREGINQGILAQAEALAAKEDYEAAIKVLAQIPDYKDVPERIAAYDAAIPVRDYNAAAALENEGKFEEAIAAFAAMNGYSDTAARIDALHEKIRQRDYAAAAALENEAKFEEAIAAFAAMNGYADSANRIEALHEKIRQRDYGHAAALEAEGKFEQAIEAFADMNGYADSANRILRLRDLIKERDYKAAEALETAGDYTAAYEMFTALGDFSDSQARAQAVTEKAEEQKRQQAYNAALTLKAEGKLNEALTAFKALGSYSNSMDQVLLLEADIQANNYNSAAKLLADGKYTEALAAFKALGNYSDSAAKAAEAQRGVDYNAALTKALAGKFKDAYNAFTKLGDYKDSKTKAEITGNLSRAGKSQEVAEGVLIYEFHGLWGIANLNTNVIVPVKYTSITNDTKSQYSKYGLLKVFIDGTEDYYTDKYGYIDHNGKEIVPCTYHKVTDFDSKGNCTVATAKYVTKSYWPYYYYYFGIMNHKGQTITKAQWRTLGASTCGDDWGDEWYSWSDHELNLPTFTNGRMKVQTESGTWGFIDENGKVLGNTNWKSVSGFSDGMAVVQNADGKYTFINEQGQTIGTNTWDAFANVNANVYVNEYGEMTEEEAAEEGYAYGSTTSGFSNGLAAVKKDGKWGFINKQNVLVIPCQYAEVKAFQADGTCDVKTTSGTWIVIDKEGKTAFFGN